MRKLNYSAGIFILFLLIINIPKKTEACYAIVAGKDATKDGSVLVAHSELNKPKNCFLNFRVIPRFEHAEDDVIHLQHGATYPDVSESYSYLWSENFGLAGSDGVMNEHGVVCVSDGTPTKETSIEDLVKSGQIEEGGVGFRLRIEVARRAKTAREGVKIVADLVERFGSRHSIHFVIADSEEAWIMALPKGKQWAAQRVPDDKVVVLPNVNIIQEINPEDTANFLMSDNLISYARKKGWYNPEEDDAFNYKQAYGKLRWVGWFEEKYDTDPRWWRGLWLVTGERTDLPPEGYLPFAVEPKKKFSVQDFREIMSDHMEGTKFDKTNGYKKGAPHDLLGPREGAICDQRNQEVAVFQLRSWMPPEVGSVYWRSTAAICSSVLTPWYAGINSVPESYHIDVPAEKNVQTDFHFNPPAGTYQYDEEKAFWIFNTLENLVDLNYRKDIKVVKPVWKEFEEEEFKMQEEIEQKALELYKKDHELSATFLTNYCSGKALQAVEKAKKMVHKLRNKHYGY